MFDHVSKMPQAEQPVKSYHITFQIYQQTTLVSYLNEHSKKVLVNSNLMGSYY